VSTENIVAVMNVQAGLLHITSPSVEARVKGSNPIVQLFVWATVLIAKVVDYSSKIPNRVIATESLQLDSMKDLRLVGRRHVHHVELDVAQDMRYPR
jgi:hypothetical protein